MGNDSIANSAVVKNEDKFTHNLKQWEKAPPKMWISNLINGSGISEQVLLPGLSWWGLFQFQIANSCALQSVFGQHCLFIPVPTALGAPAWRPGWEAEKHFVHHVVGNNTGGLFSLNQTQFFIKSAKVLNLWIVLKPCACRAAQVVSKLQKMKIVFFHSKSGGNGAAETFYEY